MRFITRDSDYAVQVLLYLSKEINKGAKNRFTVKNVSKALSLPNPHLRKVIQILAHKKILKSIKGRNGGFSLVKSLKIITMLDIVKIFQGRPDITHCYVGKNICQNIHKCGLRKKLNKVSRIMEKELKGIVLDHNYH